MVLKREQLINRVSLELNALIRELYNKPRYRHYLLSDKYSETIVKIMEEHNENSKKLN